MSLPKALWHIQKDENIIAPFDTRHRLNLKVGALYKLYARQGYYHFRYNNAPIKIINQTILLFLKIEKGTDRTIKLYFYCDNKTMIYSVYEDLDEYSCNFVEVI